MTDNRIVKLAAAAGLTVGMFKALDKKLQLSHDIGVINKLRKPFADVLNLPSDKTLADDWEMTYERITQQLSNKPAIIFAEDGRTHSFEQVERISNKIANYFLQNMEKLGLQKESTVALMMENRPEFIFTLLGLTKAGLRPAMINTNNKRKPLSHSLDVSTCKAMVFGMELSENVSTILEKLEKEKMPLLVYKDVGMSELPSSSEVDSLLEKSLDLVSAIDGFSDERPPREVRGGIGKNSIYGYIYTSGTTGLPKACIITHLKMLGAPRVLYNFNDCSSNDVFYSSLPLYHSAAGIIGLSALFSCGMTFVVARKFSSKRFFRDCYDYNCTVTQYIGEIARYLLNSEESAFDKKNQIKLVLGNGLRREIWLPFCDRFNIRYVCEVYGSTEGNITFYQRYDREMGAVGVGAVGRVGWAAKKMIKFEIVKHNVETQMPFRNKNGHCIPCADGEAGELLGFVDTTDPSKIFYGYTSDEATNSKLLKDVLQKGDLYFRTGDLIRRDAEGWIYFVDRIGDTFRWKGENVSTNEVSEVVSVYPGLLEANIYGVKVPGNEDGRACMAAIVLNLGDTSDVSFEEAIRNFDFKDFSDEMDKSLASYAKPLFLRFLHKMKQTGTFKQQKVGLVKEGVDISLISDPLFVYDPKQKTYLPLDKERYAQLTRGISRL